MPPAAQSENSTAAKRTQKQRTLALNTNLGEDVLLLRSMDYEEELGRPFRMTLRTIAEKPDAKPETLIGTGVTIRLNRPGQAEPRMFNGIVARVRQVGFFAGAAAHELTVVPWIWLLSRTRDCAIFQEMNVKEIVKDVFNVHGFTDFEEKYKGTTYPKRENCVQYRESDLDFVHRLMEHEGISYYTKHEDGKHTIVLCDDPACFAPVTGAETVPFFPPSAQAREPHVFSWMVENEIQTAGWELKDFQFKTPSTPLAHAAATGLTHTVPESEYFEYPGTSAVQAEAEHYAKLRVERSAVEHETVVAETNQRALHPGATFTLSDPTSALIPGQAKEWLVTSVRIHAENDEYGSSSAQRESGPVFSCSLTAIDATKPFRPPLTTLKPLVHGPQTAIVTGSSGQEIWTDEFGRVKVLFHWDRYAKADENSSCWIRVSQSWAGKGFGGLILPRVGQEVVVEFIDGDPDRPLITGRVYNAENKVPYKLPDNKTMSTLKSSTSKGGAGFNELRFEDKKDEEQVFLHAQKNLDIRVLNDRFEWIGRNRHLVVKASKLEHVHNNRHEIVENDHKEQIKKDRNVEVSGKEAVKITGSKSLTVDGDVIEVFKANQSTEVTADHYLKADNICIEGLTNVTIKVGDSFIAIESSGIKIGTTGEIVLEADGNITFDSGADIGSMAEGMVSASAKSDFAVEAGGAAAIVATGDFSAEGANATVTGSSSGTFDGGGSTSIKGGSIAIG